MSSSTAKTPSRPRHARPGITPSAITLGLNSLSLSPTKSVYNNAPDSSNPFIDRRAANSSNPFVDRKNSPTKARGRSRHGSMSSGGLDHLAKDAVRGIVRPGGIETKFDVVRNDYFVGESKGSTSPRKRKGSSVSLNSSGGYSGNKLKSSASSVSTLQPRLLQLRVADPIRMLFVHPLSSFTSTNNTLSVVLSATFPCVSFEPLTCIY